MHPKAIEKLIKLFSKFPAVGPRTASRFVFYLTKLPQSEIKELSSLIDNLHEDIKICPSCFNAFDASEQTNLCPICSSDGRDKSLLCIVEKEADLITIENTKTYKGLYFILGGTINFKKDDIGNIRIEELKKRIENNPEIKEIIIAINPTTEGEATALLIERVLSPYKKKTTRLGRGLPVGGELEYADPDTLESAFQGRK